MVAVIEDRLDAIRGACERFHVARLDVFGSALRDDFEPGRSDIDFLYPNVQKGATMRKSKGFTLIELLIVIAIIGILAAVLIPNLLTARLRAGDTATMTCLRELATRAEVVRADHPFQYPNPHASPSTAFGPASRPYPFTADFINVGHPARIPACDGVFVEFPVQTATDFTYTAFNALGGQARYVVRDGEGVTLLR